MPLCSLTLSIESIKYSVHPFHSEGRLGWELTERPSKVKLNVTRDRWGVVRCTCDEAKGQNPEKFLCRHARALQACSLIAPSYRAKNKPKEYKETAV